MSKIWRIAWKFPPALTLTNLRLSYFELHYLLCNGFGPVGIRRLSPSNLLSISAGERRQEWPFFWFSGQSLPLNFDPEGLSFFVHTLKNPEAARVPDTMQKLDMSIITRKNKLQANAAFINRDLLLRVIVSPVLSDKFSCWSFQNGGTQIPSINQAALKTHRFWSYHHNYQSDLRPQPWIAGMQFSPIKPEKPTRVNPRDRGINSPKSCSGTTGDPLGKVFARTDLKKF